ncbi:amino acid ABC transporter permease [Burkholderia stagnalis]
MAYHFDWSVIYQYRHELAQGVAATLILTAMAWLASACTGVALAVLACFGACPVRRLATAICDVTCNIPPVVQAFFVYFGVGSDSLWAALIGISVYAAGQIGETLRAGIRTLPESQMESAISSGMHTRHVIAYIVLPQAIEEMLHPLASRFVNILKNTSLGMTVGYAELTFQSRQIETLTFRGVEAITASMVGYAVFGGFVLFGFSLLGRRLQRRRAEVIS